MEKRDSRERDQQVRKHGRAGGIDTLKEMNEVAQRKRVRRQGWLKNTEVGRNQFSDDLFAAILWLWFELCP